MNRVRTRLHHHAVVLPNKGRLRVLVPVDSVLSDTLVPFHSRPTSSHHIFAILWPHILTLNILQLLAHIDHAERLRDVIVVRY